MTEFLAGTLQRNGELTPICTGQQFLDAIRVKSAQIVEDQHLLADLFAQVGPALTDLPEDLIAQGGIELIEDFRNSAGSSRRLVLDVTNGLQLLSHRF